LDSLSLTWWMWLLLGLVLMALEMLTPGGFYILFFGVGAVVVGLLDLAGLQMSFPAEGLVFVLVSVISIMLFRKPLQQRFQGKMPKGKVDNLVGETAQALEEIGVNAIGKAELRGAAWNAHNVGDAPIPRSARCRVERVDGLTLHIRS
jgi:inner membrane protein